MRILNDAGVADFQEYLEAGAAGASPKYLLNNPGKSEEFTFCTEAYPYIPKDATKWQLAGELAGLLGGVDRNQMFYNRNLWASLALEYLDLICPSDNGKRKVGEMYRYIPPAERNYRHYYRHLIRTPVWTRLTYGDIARYLLSSPPHKGGDLIETFASRQEIISNKGIIEVAGELYFDKIKGKIKTGATNSVKGGDARRLIKVVQQFELTYDMLGMTASEIMPLLPNEFSHWLPGKS